MPSMNPSTLESLKRRLPMPIAQAMGRALEAVRPADQMREWRVVMDMLMGYINALAVAEYCSMKPVSRVDKYVCDVPQQTDGGRAIHQVSSIFKHLKSNPNAFCQPFIRWFYSEVEVLGTVQKTHQHLQAMVTLRNVNTHARLKQSEMDVFIEGCVTLLKRCFALQEYTLFVVREQEPLPTGVEGWISVLMGESPSAATSVFWSGVTLMTRGVYVLDSSREALLQVSPMLIWREDSDVRRTTLFSWRLVRKSIEYNSVLSSGIIQEYPQRVIGRGEDVSWTEWLEDRPLLLCHHLDHGGFEWGLDDLSEEEEEEIEESEEGGDVEISSFAWGRVLGLAVLLGLMAGLYMLIVNSRLSIGSNMSLMTGDEDSDQIEDVTFKLELGTLPSTNQVYLDDEEIDATTLISVSRGLHTLRIEQSGYVCYQGTLDLQHVASSTHSVDINWDCAGVLGWDWIQIPAGDFVMGEQRVPVTLSKDFVMLSSEVTREMWRQVKSLPLRDSCLQCPQPASWNEAIEFANQLSELENLQPCYQRGKLTSLSCEGYRLPTEAEWEYAAKAGTNQRFAGSNSPNTVAYFEFNSNGHSHPVKERAPNQWGLYDMSGNVYEWCQDDYVDSLIGGIDPWMEKEGSNKVGKGGSYRSQEAVLAVSNRTSTRADVSVPFIGFRLVRTLPKP